MLNRFLTAFLCYLYGSIPFAFVYTYVFKRERITELGSKNAGVANTFTVVGTLPGVLTVLGEISKAIVPILVSFYYYGYDKGTSVLFVASSFVGTNFSLFLMFRGGMGFTIFMWSLLILSPLSLVGIGALMLLIRLFAKDYSKTVSYSEKVKYLLPLVLYLTTFRASFAYYGLVVAVVYVVKRKQNLADIQINTQRTFNPVKEGVKKYYKAHPRYLFYLDEVGRRFPGGNKAKNLAFLRRNEYEIPSTLVCSYKAFELYTESPDLLLNDLREELMYYIGGDLNYAVRSSANIEDRSDYSFAGQFDTFLNVQGVEEVLQKIESIWDSTFNERFVAYSNNLADSTQSVKMGVIVQEMVQSQFSGVVFTKNPITGLDEIVVESVEGFGINLMQKGGNPRRGVYKWGKWREFPENLKDQKAVYDEIATKAQDIEKSYGQPVDLEWAYDGEVLFWLQLRKITTTRNTDIYSNKMAKEMLPGIIKPLVWSINIPMVNSSWKRIFVETIGSSVKDLRVEDLARSFYYRTYFNMGVIGDLFEILGMPRNLLETMSGIVEDDENKPKFQPSGKTLRYVPRLLFFALRMFAFTKRAENFLQNQKKNYQAIEEQLQKRLSSKESLQIIDELFKLGKQTSYYVIICQMLNEFHASAIKKKLEAERVPYEELDFSLINEKLRLFDPSQKISKLHQLFVELGGNEDNSNVFLEEMANASFKEEYGRFMKRFGYFRDSGNDFSDPSWSETPDVVMKVIANHVSPNHQYTSKHKLKKILTSTFSTPFDKFRLRQSLRYLELREKISALYTYGYGLFRPVFLHISQNFVEDGLFKDLDDLFYLKHQEVKDLVWNPSLESKMRKRVQKRRQEIQSYENIVLPEIIYGEKVPDELIQSKSPHKLQGVPTSSGYFVGPLKIVYGLKDIEKIEQGDAIAIPYSEVSWTPLFNKVKGIISESGGMLSHCSIVAREYNIPSVVSVEGATSLKDGTIVAIDGYKGTVTIIDF